jgi:hypothetical protein
MALALAITTVLFLLLSRARWLRRQTRWWPVRRLSSSVAEIAAVKDAPGVTAMIAEVLLTDPESGAAAPDVQPPASNLVADAMDQALSEITQLKGIGAMLGAMGRLFPRRRFVVRGELLAPGLDGEGFGVQILNWRGKRVDSRLFWQSDWASGITDKPTVQYALAEAAGWWVREVVDR